MLETIKRANVTTKKPHMCMLCRREIDHGENACCITKRAVSGRYNTMTVFTLYYCAECQVSSADIIDSIEREVSIRSCK